MLILTIRTDKPEAEVGLFGGDQKLTYETWTAHRELSLTIHNKIAKILQFAGKEFQDVKGVVVFQGPGSFTGLRIGLSVANALAEGLNISIAAATGDDWIKQGMQSLKDGNNDIAAMPFYGSEVHISSPKR